MCAAEYFDLVCSCYVFCLLHTAPRTEGNGTVSDVEGVECPTAGVPNGAGSEESEFISLLTKAVPVSTIRAMVADQHRQAEQELQRVKKLLDDKAVRDSVSV